MKINAITNSVVQSKYESRSLKNSRNTVIQAPISNENKEMLPTHYYSDIAFKRDFSVGEINKIISKAPLGDKITVALTKVTVDDLLIVSSSIEKAKQALKKPFECLAQPLRKLYFLKAPNIKENLLFGKTSLNELLFWNVEEDSVFVNIIDIPENALVKLHKNTIMRLSNMLLILNGSCIDNKRLLNENVSKYVQEFDYSKDIESFGERHNHKILDNMVAQSINPVQKKKNVSFSEVGGQQEAIDLIKKNVIFPLKYPDVFANLTSNRGVILSGPPGCGKTLLAEIAGRESGASVFKINGPELDSKYVGESEANWRDLVSKAIDAQPSIVFIDEIDAIAKKRGGHDVYGDKVLNQVLALMSDIEKNGDNVYFIGSTNRIESLDDAFMRSGRFGLHIEMKAPDLDGTREIFDIHTNNKPLSEDLDKNAIIKAMHDKKMSGADIAVTVSKAYTNAMEREGIYASMENGTFFRQMIDYLKITDEDFIEAINSFKPQNKNRNPIGFNK